MNEKKITAWSYSRWACYEDCPARAKFKFVDKLPEPQGPALARGDDIHKKIEQYLRAGGKMPVEAKSLDKEYRALRKRRPFVELQLAYDADWKPVDWFAKEAWCRIMIDAFAPPTKKITTADVVDHKTGKIREGEYDLQLELYGLAGLLYAPTAEEVRSKLYFVDHGKIYDGTTEERPEGLLFRRSDESALKKTWTKRVVKMLSDTRFAPNPGNSCRWCAFSRAKGGPCQY